MAVQAWTNLKLFGVYYINTFSMPPGVTRSGPFPFVVGSMMAAKKLVRLPFQDLLHMNIYENLAVGGLKRWL